MAIRDRQWILFEPGAGCGNAHSALRDSSQLDNAFGDQIHVGLHRLVNLIEKFMQPDKVRAFHVPMRLFQLHLKIHSVCQPLVHEGVEF